MKKALIIPVIALFAVPVLSSAAMYHYVDVHGQINTVEASSPAEALMLAQRTGDILHSGITLDQDILQPGEIVGMKYMYVDVYGNVRTVTAASLDATRMIVTDRASNSGFLIVGPAV